MKDWTCWWCWRDSAIILSVALISLEIIKTNQKQRISRILFHLFIVEQKEEGVGYYFGKQMKSWVKRDYHQAMSLGRNTENAILYSIKSAYQSSVAEKLIKLYSQSGDCNQNLFPDTTDDGDELSFRTTLYK